MIPFKCSLPIFIQMPFFTEEEKTTLHKLVETGHPFHVQQFLTKIAERGNNDTLLQQWWKEYDHRMCGETDCEHSNLLNEICKYEQEELNTKFPNTNKFHDFFFDLFGFDNDGDSIKEYNPYKVAFILKNRPDTLDWHMNQFVGILSQVIQNQDFMNLETIIGILESQGRSLHTILKGHKNNPGWKNIPEAIQRHLDHVV